MFESKVIVKPSKKKIFILFTTLFIISIIILIFQILTGCTYPQDTYNSFYCQGKNIIKGEILSINRWEATSVSESNFVYTGDELSTDTLILNYLELLLSNGTITWIKTSCTGKYNEAQIRILYETIFPDYSNNKNWYIFANNANLTQSGYNIISLYYWNSQKTAIITYIDSSKQIINNVNILNYLDIYQKDISIINFRNITLSTQYMCTGCGRGNPFKLSDFWKILIGLSSLVSSTISILTLIFIKDITYDVVTEKDILLDNN